MKMGIIIVFDLIDKTLPKKEFINNFKKAPNVNFCLVNNDGDEFLSEYLTDISDRCENVNVVNIKKSRGLQVAVRSGARFLNSHFNLKYLGYIQNSDELEVIESLDLFNTHKERIKEDLESDADTVKKSFLKNIFSVAQYVLKFNADLGNLAKSF